MSLQSRPKEKQKFSTPAPGEYDVNRAGKMVVGTSPKYTFGLKTQTDKTSTTPGNLETRFIHEGNTIIYISSRLIIHYEIAPLKDTLPEEFALQR